MSATGVSLLGRALALLAVCGAGACAQVTVTPSTQGPATGPSPQQVAAALSAGSRAYPIGWCVAGSLERQVDFAGAPMQRNAVMFYELSFGKCPRIWSPSPSSPLFSFEHGGVYQRCDWAGHFAKAAADIAREIPDPNWDGYAILDIEYAEPVWDLLDVPRMKEESRRLVRQASPGLSAAQVEARAKQEYEAAAMDFRIRTLEFCKQQRPRAKWGYYGYPYPHQEPYRAQYYQRMFDSFTAFYPAFYCVDYSVNQPTLRSTTAGRRDIGAFEGNLAAQMTICRQIAGTRPIAPLIWLRYHENNTVYAGQFLNDLDLAAVMRLPKQLGGSATILWDVVDSQQRLQGYNQYFRTKAAPAITNFYLQMAPPPAQAPAPSQSGAINRRGSSVDRAPRTLPARTYTQEGQGEMAKPTGAGSAVQAAPAAGTSSAPASAPAAGTTPAAAPSTPARVNTVTKSAKNQ